MSSKRVSIERGRADFCTTSTRLTGGSTPQDVGDRPFRAAFQVLPGNDLEKRLRPPSRVAVSA